MKCILGTKIGMTQVFKDDGTVVPVTRVQAGPCVVTQIKTREKGEVDAIQIGYKDQKPFRLSKAEQGHLKGLPTKRILKDVRADGGEHGLSRGDEFDVTIFDSGEKVQVTGVSKGKGFQGVVKRHNFAGSPASHGHKDQLRMPGSIGATDAARVFKGTRMAGRMGGDQVTIKNLEVVEIHPEKNELYIKGAVPGATGSLLMIYTPEGKIDIKTEEEVTKSEEVQENMVKETEETTPEEVTQESNT